MASPRRGTRHTALQALKTTVSVSGDRNAAPEIVEAAISSFDEVGNEQTSFSRIAELAGTSKSLVTYFFPTKRALAGTIVELAYPGGVFMGTKRADHDPLDAIVSWLSRLQTAFSEILWRGSRSCWSSDSRRRLSLGSEDSADGSRG